MIDRVEDGLDVQIDNPRRAPAPLPRRPDRVDRRSTGPVSIGVPVKPRFQQRLEIPPDHRLGDTV